MAAAVPGALILPTANPGLEWILRDRIERRRETTGSFGELETLALRIGLIQDTESTQLRSARLVIFAADHGLAIDDIGGPAPRSTAETVGRLLEEDTPLVAFARVQDMPLTIVDAGVADSLPRHGRLLPRKIAHGTRNCRVGAAMTTEQAHAAMRAGMEIGHTLGGNAVACAGTGSGSAQSAALLLSCLSGAPLREFVDSRSTVAEALQKHLLRVLEEARNRHGHLVDPVELLAAVGGFEVAMMTGLMLAAASRRRLVIADGLSACAALMVAAQIAPAFPDYCLCARSSASPALTHAFDLLGAKPVGDIGIDSIDGVGATLAWPVLRCASALLSGEAVASDVTPTAPARAASTPSASHR